jgi:hypothetical protein
VLTDSFQVGQAIPSISPITGHFLQGQNIESVNLLYGNIELAQGEQLPDCQILLIQQLRRLYQNVQDFVMPLVEAVTDGLLPLLESTC